MRSLRTTVAALVALAAVVGSMVATTSIAAARPEPGPRQGPRGCSAQDYLGANDVLRPGRALCNGNYLLRMQENGDLVLREISSGRACWHSNTFVSNTSAVVRAGRGVTLLVGAKEVAHSGDGTNVNLNSKGELWVGMDPVGKC